MKLFGKTPWKRQPQTLTGVDRLWSPTAAWNFNTGFECVSRLPPKILSGQGLKSPAPIGVGSGVSGTSSMGRFVCNSLASAVTIGADDFTVFITFKYSTSTAAYSAFGRWNTGASVATCDWYLGAASTFATASATFTVAAGSSVYTATASGSWVNGETYTLVGRRKGTTIYVDRYTHSTGAVVSGSTTNAGITTVNYNSARATKLGEIDAGAVYNAAITAYVAGTFKRYIVDVAPIFRNPWQVFQPLGRNLGFSPPASGPGTHPASGDLLGGAAVLTGTATRLRTMTSSGALVGGEAALAGTARSNHQHPTAGALGGAGATLAGTAARAGGAVTHSSSGVLVGQGATLAGIAVRTPAVVTHATSGVLSGQGATLAGTAARVAAPVTHATSGDLAGPGARLSGTAQNGAIVPPVINSGGGAGGGARVKNRRELDDLLTKALKKPVEVAVQLLLPVTPSPEAISSVARALEARDATANKSAARQAQSLLARLQVLEREAEDEEAAVMTLLLD